MIHFKRVSKDNFEEVISLQLKDDQVEFLESNLYSLAETYVDSSLEPRAIYKGEDLIGFMLYYFKEAEADYVYLKRLMLDKKFQGQSLGRKSMEKALSFFKEEYPSIACVELMHYLDNEGGDHLYESLGFEPTGEVRETIRPGTDIFDREKVRRYYFN